MSTTNNHRPPMSCPHPMTDVPDAIRMVLQETARLLLTNPRADDVRSIYDDTLLHSQLAAPVLMQEPGYPPYRASIMDGYAIRVADTFQPTSNDKTETIVWTHSILDKVFAGDTKQPNQQPLSPSSLGLPPAYYVTTGAVVPESFDCVVPIEECIIADNHATLAVTSKATVAVDKWIRPVGSDIAAGSVVLEAGHVLDPVALGLLRQSGCNEVQIKRAVSVGVLSTGNELLSSGTEWKEQASKGVIPDVNRPILLSLLKTYGNCNCIDLGMARDDDIEGMTKLLESQLEHCEVILTTGGISMGETDIVEEVLVNKLGGKLHFGRMNMKPGKPTTFVSIPSKFGTRLAFAMPGNPVSATVCTQLLVRPCLDLLYTGGDLSLEAFGDGMEEHIGRLVENAHVHPEIQAVLTHDVKLDTGRPEYHRVIVNTQSNGTYNVRTTGIQQSSRLLSMRDADGLLVLPKATPDKPKALTGETYTVLLVRDLPMITKTRLSDSKHLNRKPARSLHVGVVLVDAERDAVDSAIGGRIIKALSGSKSGSVSLGSLRHFPGPPQGLYDYLVGEKRVDIHVVVGSQFKGASLLSHLEVANDLRSKLSKVADAMALQARRGAASQDATSVLFEVVVGYIPEGHGSIVIFLPDQGLDSGLGNVRGLLKHALEIARGKGRGGGKQ